MENESSKEFREIITRWIENQKECLKPLTNDEIKNISIIETIIKNRSNEIRDQLIIIRTLLDENSMKGKQKLTNLIKEIQ